MKPFVTDAPHDLPTVHPTLTAAHLDRNWPTANPPVTAAHLDRNSPTVKPQITAAGLDRDSPSVKPSMTAAGLDRDSPSVKPPMTAAHLDRDSPTVKPPVTAARLDRDRQIVMFPDEDAPPTTITRGNAGEQRAAAYLTTIGMRIVERNFKTRLGELDIIARDGSTLVFVEVRTRTTTTFGSAVEAVNHTKQRKVTRLAWQYIKVRRPPFETARFDVIGITAGDLVHIRNAWRLG